MPLKQNDAKQRIEFETLDEALDEFYAKVRHCPNDHMRWLTRALMMQNVLTDLLTVHLSLCSSFFCRRVSGMNGLLASDHGLIYLIPMLKR